MTGQEFIYRTNHVLCYADILAGRLLCLNAARMKEAGIPFVLEVCISVTKKTSR